MGWIEKARELETRVEDFVRKGMQKIRPAVSSFLGHTPPANTREDQAAYTISVDLPGVRKDDITLSVDSGVLLLKAERSMSREHLEKDYYRMESYFGQIQRSFVLPPEVDEEKLSASLENGVLRISIPVDQNKLPRRIDIS
ncbi:Hsp20/alpha crystallin family protein [Desulfurispirillum indicum]|uniref:Heat shock protein Hsp20 n=1 Tax=Desulfurispirillum indicum (strain ATCC BAA-1389 / DSM 22839 / S5) TaxID=653733 RepID=E6W235_DESIS|nr:Hsp20/alpha crystallin family protein [Desulfurispirillum indicum]ADU66661.1 heat shock protein Hsp20 [Desulfurispirillum indicum S5]UCZ55979.1 Hsp20/alpha crystallin family protein [Desulfurispirillum indicum]